MTQIDLNPTTLERDLVVVRALHSLTNRHFDQVVDALPALPGAWHLDRHIDYDGYLCFLLTAVNGGKTFLISGRPDRIELAEQRGDQLYQLGCFETIESATQRLAEEL